MAGESASIVSDEQSEDSGQSVPKGPRKHRPEDHQQALNPRTIPINLENLPAIPDLLPDVADIPFTHKSYIEETLQSSGHYVDAEFGSHKRSEHLGDAVFRLRAVAWIYKQHYVDVGVSSVS